MKDRWQYIYGALLLVGADLFFILRSSQNFLEKRLFALFIPFVAAIIFWFFTAPDWRFLGAIPQLFIGLSGWIFLRISIPRSISTYNDKWPPYVASSFVSIIVLVLMTKTADFKTLPLTGWHSIPKVEVVRKETNSNLPVWIPANGDQCWDSVLPCAPKLNEELRLRGTDNSYPDSLKHGFSVRK